MLADTLPVYMAAIDDPEFVAFACREGRVDKEWIATSRGEVAEGLSVLSGHDLSGKRILEVGAGAGLLSILLHRQGYDVTALDPSLGGFEANADFSMAIRKWFNADDLPFLRIGGADLNVNAHGRFDIIFSVNVLEHIPDLRAAFHGMASVLSERGQMVHLCPNYTVPYEPHFGLPLVPFFPRALELLRPTLKKDGLWRSLNFVTCRQIRRYAKECGLSANFTPAMMRRAFERLDMDPTYCGRQRGLVTAIFAILKPIGVLPLIGKLPYQMATPMLFECHRAA